MDVQAVPAEQLAPEQLAVWSELQQGDPALDSPFFAPEYTQAVAAHCDNVEVGVFQEGGRPVGFLPFQRLRGNVGVPVGGNICNFHGAVARPGVAFDAAEVVRRCRLAAWTFESLTGRQESFLPYHWIQYPAPFLDLSQGFAAYQAGVRRRGSKAVKLSLQKTRKLEREAGEVRFQPDTHDRQVLDTVIAWKRAQYRRIKSVNYLSEPWKLALLADLLGRPRGPVRGMLSALYVDGRLAAAHFGLRCRGVLHGWFPVYDADLAHHSPGMVLWLKLAQAAEDLGISRIDLGKGLERYKLGLMSDAGQVLEGSVDLRPLKRFVRRSMFRARRWVRSSPLRGPASFVARSTRGLMGVNR